MSTSNLLFKYGLSFEHRDEKDSRFANERYHANIQNDGTFSVILKCAVALQMLINLFD